MLMSDNLSSRMGIGYVTSIITPDIEPRTPSWVWDCASDIKSTIYYEVVQEFNPIKFVFFPFRPCVVFLHSQFISPSWLNFLGFCFMVWESTGKSRKFLPQISILRLCTSLSAGVRALLNKFVCLIFSLFVKKPRNGTFSTHERLRLRYFPAGEIQLCRCLTGGRKTPKLLCLVCSVLLCLFVFIKRLYKSENTTIPF